MRDVRVAAAVAELGNSRVSVFSVGGDFVCHWHVGVGVLPVTAPCAVALACCCAFDELVIADTQSSGIRMFSGVGDLLMAFGSALFTGIAVHGSTVLRVRAVCAVGFGTTGAKSRPLCSASLLL